MEALAALLRAALEAELGSGIVETVLDHPVTFGEVSTGGLPSLSLYVGSSRAMKGPSYRLDQRITVVFDYVIAQTTFDARQRRWPAMRAVWNRIAETVWDGYHSTLDSGAKVLEAAGLYILRHSPIGEASFGMVERLHPHFRATLKFDSHGEEVDASTLVPLLGIYTGFDVVDGNFDIATVDLTNETTAQNTAPPYGYDLTVLPGYGS